MNDSKSSTSKCFHGVLRWLLCTGSLQTHPSDLITDPNDTAKSHRHPPEKDPTMAAKQQAPATPGIVARLMGLESMPEINWSPESRRRATLVSFLRSKSASSFDFLPEIDRTHGHHRRVRTSVSFREVPTFLQQRQSHDFFVLCFEKVGESHRMSLSVEHLAERKKKFVQKKEDRENMKFQWRKEEPTRFHGKSSRNLGNANLNDKNKIVHGKPSERNLKTRVPVKPMNQRKKNRSSTRKIKPLCSSENSSPVSVLDATNHQIISAEECRLRASNSRRKPKPSSNPSPNSSRAFMADDHALKARKRNRMRKPMNQEHVLVSEICRLTEEEMMEDPSWVAAKSGVKYGDVEGICREFGQQILELLVDEVVQLTVIL